MIVNNISEGDVCTYQGNSYIVSKKIFKVSTITNLDKQISLDLIDETGSHITANFWKSDYGRNPNIYLDGDEYRLVEISSGDTIEMFGYEYMYGQYKQFNPIGGYRLCQETINYSSSINSVKMLDLITTVLSNITDKNLSETCVKALKLYYSDFIKMPAASKHHHNYVGGLLHHTFEVINTAINISLGYKVNLDYIVAGAFFHDIMKIKEYDIDGKWQDYGDKIGHVSGSAIAFECLAKENGCSQETIDSVVHIILSHHGKKEWGSPVEPKTPEAVIVHEADMISSYINPLYTSDSKKDYYNM